MKHEWRKAEKKLYLPKTKPEIITIPAFSFFSIKGNGNPNNDFFAEYIQVLYSLSYGLKMGLKKNPVEDYQDYTVYPLEGVWDISEEAKAKYENDQIIDKDTLIFKLMIRQPDFIATELAQTTIETVKKKKPHELLDKAVFERIEEGKCIQMLHVGPYDNEPESFKAMEGFAKENGLERISHKHREIYLSDARKVAPEKLKTVLRFKVK